MTEIHVAIAILYRDGKFLCQLRDDVPNIRFSEQSGDVRSLGQLHQRILLNFIESIA